MVEGKIDCNDVADEVCAKLDSLGGYVNPGKVVPLKGAAAHEVAVGPVHAGVIEPGHFRFQCMGEDVFNLQIFLGYQHRGVEDAIVAADGSVPRQIALAETCAGDTSAAAATAFAELMEGMFPSRFPRAGGDALRVRALLSELERIAKEMEKAQNGLRITENKLKNEKFVANAPEAVVNAEREKAAKYRELIAKLEESAKAMQA